MGRMKGVYRNMAGVYLGELSLGRSWKWEIGIKERVCEYGRWTNWFMICYCDRLPVTSQAEWCYESVNSQVQDAISWRNFMNKDSNCSFMKK
jgi:hypothetical protein